MRPSAQYAAAHNPNNTGDDQLHERRKNEQDSHSGHREQPDRYCEQ